LPHGWIGTTSQWVRGFGIAFVLLNLALIAFAWRSLLHREAVTPVARGWLLVSIGLVPTMVAFLSFAHGLEGSTTVAACGSCHLIRSYVSALRYLKSDTRAPTHSKTRYIH